VEISTVKDGQEAIDYLSGEDQFADRKAHPFPRLLLLDLKMPKVDGFEVLHWLQGHPELRRMLVAVLTSSSESRDVTRAYDLGANSYLVKPQSLDDLVAMATKLNGYWLDLNYPPDCLPRIARPAYS